MNIESFTLTRAVVNEQLVRELDRKRHHELFRVALLGVALTVAVILYAWPHFEMIRLGYRMEELRQQREELFEVKHHLELQRATESDPARIESIAKNGLGMDYPAAGRILVLEPIEAESAIPAVPAVDATWRRER
ncbi:MAG: cell division protein FtsL [Vicinamibacteria bacterium]